MEIIPAPASGIMSEVVTELLWTTAVISTPMLNPMKSFRNKYRLITISIFDSTRERIVFINAVRARKRRMRDTPIITNREYGIRENRPSSRSITGSIMSFNGLKIFRPPAPAKSFSRAVAVPAIKCVCISNGNITTTAQILKKS